VYLCVWGLQTSLHAILDGLDELATHDTARVAIVTFSDVMHFYDIRVRTLPRHLRIAVASRY
jgi:hypothetical protein